MRTTGLTASHLWEKPDRPICCPYWDCELRGTCAIPPNTRKWLAGDTGSHPSSARAVMSARGCTQGQV
jgi:hypothetical protein